MHHPYHILYTPPFRQPITHANTWLDVGHEKPLAPAFMKLGKAEHARALYKSR